MSNPASTGSSFNAHVAPPPPIAASKEPPSPPNWAAIAALFISIGTFFKTIWSDSRGNRQKAQAKFETDFGTPIRTGLREYEKHIRAIRIYTLPSEKTVDELKEEIAKARSAWLDAAFDISRLLDEADSSGKIVDGNWASAWLHETEKAEQSMLLLTEDSTTSILDLSTHARNAKVQMEVALARVRLLLQTHVDKY